MAVSEAERFELFLKDSFGEGINVRELRLSDEEAKLVQGTYPDASLKKYQTVESFESKAWYEITLLPPKMNEKEKLDSISLAAIQKENEMLKQELESLRKMRNLTDN